MTTVDTAGLLQEGIAAARNGDRSRSVELLRQVTGAEPENESAWLWLANAAADPAEAVACLRHVLDINPTNHTAAAALPDALVRAGAAAAGHDRDAARALLAEATDLAPRNETAWLWRAGLAETPAEAATRYEQVLAINPNSEKARQGLANCRNLLAEPWKCPLCGHTQAGRPGPACPNCGGAYSLSDPAAFPAGKKVNRKLLKVAARRLHDEYEAEPTARRAYDLGLAYLNLGYFEEGLQGVQTAARAPGAEPEWAQQVAALLAFQTAGPEAEAPPPNPVVVVVDDSPTVRSLVSVTLGRYGYEVVEATDGHDAAEKLGKTGPPGAIVLDVQLPGLDGFQVCKLLRQNPDTAKVPVIFLTAKDGFLNKVRGQMAGGSEYLTKPFDQDRLLEAVAKYVPAPNPGG